MAVNWFIRPVDEGTNMTCEKNVFIENKKTECFKLATWYVEGNFYCDECKKEIVTILEEL
jgi:hypothetical protein